RLDRRVETRNVVDALRRKDGNAFAATCGLLHARTDCLQPGPELSPSHLVGMHLGCAAVVEVAIRRRVPTFAMLRSIRDISVAPGGSTTSPCASRQSSICSSPRPSITESL